MAGLLTKISGAEELHGLLLGGKDIAPRRKVGHGIDDEIDVQQTAAFWPTNIRRDPGSGVAQNGAELRERYGLSREAAGRTTLANDLPQGTRGSKHWCEGAQRIGWLSAP